MLAKIASSFLYGISPHDALTFTLVPIVLVLVALVAAWIPARRAASINPIQAIADRITGPLLTEYVDINILMSMRKPTLTIIALAFAASLIAGDATQPSWAQTTPYPAMAPLADYLMPSQDAEIALARSAAPKSVSDAADVMVLTRDGYITAAKGTNGFVCIVDRSWDSPIADPDYWNPKIRSPNCFNPAAARTYLPISLMKTNLVLAGKSKTEIVNAIHSALDSKQLPPLEPGAMCYMMSHQQYLNDRGKAWHPHLMFIVPGDAAATWGANHDDSPVLAANDTEDRLTVFMVVLKDWSDGTPGPATN
jgi:hypothetical protein